MVEAQRKAALPESERQAKLPSVSDAAQAAQLDTINKNLLHMVNETFKTQTALTGAMADIPLWNMMLKDLAGFRLFTGFAAGPKEYNRLAKVGEEIEKRQGKFANSALGLHKHICDIKAGKEPADGFKIAAKAQRMLEDYNRYMEGLIGLREMIAAYKIEGRTKWAVATIDGAMTVGMFFGLGAIASSTGKAIAKEGIKEGLSLTAKAMGQGAKAALTTRMLVINGAMTIAFTGMEVFNGFQLSKSMKDFEASPQQGIASTRAMLDKMESKLAGNKNASEIRKVADAERIELNLMEAQAREPGYKVDAWRIAKTCGLMFGTFLLFETGLGTSRIVNAEIGGSAGAALAGRDTSRTKGGKAEGLAVASGEEFAKGIETLEGLKTAINRMGLDASAQENVLKNINDITYKGGKMPSMEELVERGYLVKDKKPTPEEQWEKSMEFLADREKRMKILRKEISAEFSNIGMPEKLANTYAGILVKLIDISERSGYTEYGHDTRTAAYVARMLEHMDNITARDKAVIRLAALMHDIGKAGVRNQLLRKPGPLEAAERTEMDKHAEYSYQMLKGIFKDIGGISDADAEAIAELARDHHESFCGFRKVGNEYIPTRLSGEEIPIGARLLALADNYDAMLSPRSYREGLLTQEEVIFEIKKKKAEFDPLFFDIFMKKVVLGQK
jgi:response regulator RpfG family c-di-GMP phosphodiesterase